MIENETAKRLARRLGRLGYDVGPRKETAEYLESLNFDVRTVIDVGVAGGTPLIYDAFPDAKFVLVEPIAGFERKLRKNWKGKIDFDFHTCGLGAEKGEMELTIPYMGERAMGTRATLTNFDRDGEALFTKLVKQIVPVRRLDDLVSGYDKPFGLKIDTEGFEIEVLKGAGDCLKECAFVLAEVSVRRRFANGYRFSDFASEMAKHGFEIHDFLRAPQPGSGDCDAIFAPYDSPLFDFRDAKLTRMSAAVSKD